MYTHTNIHLLSEIQHTENTHSETHKSFIKQKHIQLLRMHIKTQNKILTHTIKQTNT